MRADGVFCVQDEFLKEAGVKWYVGRLCMAIQPSMHSFVWLNIDRALDWLFRRPQPTVLVPYLPYTPTFEPPAQCTDRSHYHHCNPFRANCRYKRRNCQRRNQLAEHIYPSHDRIQVRQIISRCRSGIESGIGKRRDPVPLHREDVGASRKLFDHAEDEGNGEEDMLQSRAAE